MCKHMEHLSGRCLLSDAEYSPDGALTGGLCCFHTAEPPPDPYGVCESFTPDAECPVCGEEMTKGVCHCGGYLDCEEIDLFRACTEFGLGDDYDEF